MSVRSVLGPNGSVVTALGGRERKEQLEMALAVEQALADEQTLLVEAGTGTGKTFAYLVPAILSGQRVIVSTATRALQDQLGEKDLPFLRNVLGEQVQFSVMKGLGNYLCLRRLERALVQAEGRPMQRERLVQIRKRSQEAQGAREPELIGDAASFGVSDDDPLWHEINSGSDTRVGAGCMYHERCFVTKMKLRAQEAKVVVVNHHLFFADLSLRTGDKQRWAAALPEHDAVVFDEAHQIEAIASDFFGEARNSQRFSALASDLEKFMVAHPGLPERTGRMVESACTQGARFFAELLLVVPQQGRAPWTPGQCKSELRGALLDAHGAMTLAAEALDQEQELPEAVLLARRVADFADGLARVAAVAFSDETLRDEGAPKPIDGCLPYTVREGDSVTLGILPVDVAPTLRERLFSRVPSVVLTSATLSTGSADRPSFFYTRRRLGMPASSRELLLHSPFDARSQALLYTPSDLPEPGHADFEQEAASRVLELLHLTRGGAFVLTTSRRMMLALAQHIEGEFPLFVQGRRPKTQMLDAFRKSGRGVLVGTKSFWEGVDVPGMALRLVILDRLPFPVPTDPLWQARRERVESEGGNAFNELHLPHALITLKQGFGRLLRREDDVGVVALLDRRVLTKPYGKRLLAGLPPASRTQRLSEVELFARSRVWPRLPPSLREP